MSRTPSDLEAEGTTFSTDEEGRLTDADGKKHVVFNTHRDGLMLNRLSVENEVRIHERFPVDGSERGGHRQRQGASIILNFAKFYFSKQWSLQAVDNKKYLYAGMEGLSLEDEPGAMGVFTLVQQ